jgi:addiction module RelE/StbE family toxin
MVWDLRIAKKAQKDLNSVTPNRRRKILTVLSIISNNPFTGKKLEGDLKGLYSYRAWPYRIIYKAYKKRLLIVVIRIGHRQGAYK